MTHYEFRPDGKRSRNKYVGSWTETPAPAIDLPFTVANVSQLLAIAADASDSTYTHQQIANWCDRYFARFYNDESIRDKTVDFDIAEDVSAQWDMFLANTYSLPELRTLDFTAVALPLAWFSDWIAKLDGTIG